MSARHVFSPRCGHPAFATAFSHSGRGPCERLVPEGTAVGELRVQVAKKEM